MTATATPATRRWLPRCCGRPRSGATGPARASPCSATRSPNWRCRCSRCSSRRPALPRWVT
ncbi:hypothetical protein ACFQZ4_00540 [Catellatospora coxensis]